jgi:hypothetical protein
MDGTELFRGGLQEKKELVIQRDREPEKAAE